MVTQQRSGATFANSIEWANAPAQDAPLIDGDLPGPRSAELFEKTQQYQYGSYFQMVNALPVAFTHGEGVTLTDADGNRYIDFTQGHMVAALGHAHPRITEAVANQAGRLLNVRDFPTDVRVQLMERLAAITPGDLNVFQFFNGPRPSGFLTVPAAFCYRCEYKMTYPDCGMHCTDFAERLMLTNSHGKLAGIIVEPVTNGSGARTYPDEFLPRLREIADRHDMLLIFDEFASFGRTGTWFASEHYGVVPDAVIIGKMLGNGVPISVLCVREGLKDALQQTQPSTTNGGQPAACAAALAVLDTIEEENLLEHTTALGELCLDRLQRIRDAHPSVGDARGKGLLLALDFVTDKESREPNHEAGRLFYKHCLERGLVVSGGGNNTRVCPPIVCSEETAMKAYDIAEDAIDAMERELGYV